MDDGWGLACSLGEGSGSWWPLKERRKGTAWAEASPGRSQSAVDPLLSAPVRYMMHRLNKFIVFERAVMVVEGVVRIS